MKKAVVLLSGGLDSTTTFAVAKAQGFAVYALSVDYGQRHRVELERAAVVAKELGAVEHRTVTTRPAGDRRVGPDGGHRGAEGAVGRGDGPRHSGDLRAGPEHDPARDRPRVRGDGRGVRPLHRGQRARLQRATPIAGRSSWRRSSGSPNLATKAGVEGAGKFRVHAPLLKMTKAEIIREGVRLGVDYSQTLSCYDPDAAGRACGSCDSCLLRKKGFAEAGVVDPTQYRP